MSINLPTPEKNTGSNDWGDVYGNDKALKEAGEALETGVTTLEGKFPVSRANLKAESKPFTWYTPKIIATEESKTSTEFVTLTTADEIKEVIVPENGKLLINYRAQYKSSVAAAGRAAIFIGANQLKSRTATNLESSTTGSAFNRFETVSSGFETAEGETVDVTTGQLMGAGVLEVFLAAGTYTITVKYKSASGSVTAKARKLWVAVMGY